MKIELRYLDRKTGNNYNIGGRTAFAIRETVLQYRYSNQGDFGWDWGDWTDIPTVKEEDQ